MGGYDVYGILDAGQYLKVLRNPGRFEENPVVRGVADGLEYEFVVPRDENPEISAVAARLGHFLGLQPANRRFA